MSLKSPSCDQLLLFLSLVFQQERFNWFLWFWASLIKNGGTWRKCYLFSCRNKKFLRCWHFYMQQVAWSWLTSNLPVKVIYFFGKNVVLNICQYLKRFYSYKKINNILKVPAFFIKDTKNHRNRLNHSCWKTKLKNITNMHINRLGPP